MRRLHLFEFGDRPWLPRSLREAMTGYLASIYTRSQLPALWAARLEETLAGVQGAAIVDLGSGSGGPAGPVTAALARFGQFPAVTLTDLYPPANLRSNSSYSSYWPEPVDARSVPWDLRGVRTMFASFHHFGPDDARRILADAAWCGAPICIFEATSRTPAAIASSLFIPILVLLQTPAIRPIRLWRLVLTYLIPVLPLLIFWDGLVSHLRTYTPEEMLAMGSECSSQTYHWTAGVVRVPGLRTGLPYLVGEPGAKASAGAARGEVHRRHEPLESRIGADRVHERIDVEDVREDCAILD